MTATSVGSTTEGSAAGTRAHGTLLAVGIAAGPLYMLLGVVQILTRDGFDVRRHALSHLALGEHGWVQIANFVVGGAFVVAGAIGRRGVLRGRPGGTWGPLLLGLFGIGMIGAGIFPPDPAQGFPPGAQAPEALSRSGILHFALGGVGFYALIAAGLVFARHFGRAGRRGFAIYSLATSLLFFASFAAVASGSTSSVVLVAFYVVNAWMWVWLTSALVQVRRAALARDRD